VNQKKGLFIAFEGLDGSGETTQADLLANRLGHDTKTIVTKEPTNNLIGGLIRGQLTKDWSTTQECLQLLFAADRAHHLERVIQPAINKGYNAITDRYMFSSLAFGGVNIDLEWLKALNSKFRLPDYTFFLDVPPEVCIERMEKSRFELELFEQREYLKKVHENYKALAKDYENFHVIDGNDYKEEVHKRIVEVLGL
jgi:dTMP kinase